MGPLREEADRIAAQIPLPARKHLAGLLGDALNIVDNLEVICPNLTPPCRDYMRFERLRAMHAALTARPSNAQRSDA